MFQKFAIGHYRFSLICQSPVQFDGFPGATLRGACADVLFTEHADVYKAVVKNKAQSKQDAPRPYVFAPRFPDKLHYAPGEELVFDLTLVGRAIPHVQAFIDAFTVLGVRGIGTRRHEGFGRILLDRVMVMSHENSAFLAYCRGMQGLLKTPGLLINQHALEVAASLPANELALHFVTPLRLKNSREWLRKPNFEILFKRLSMRMRNLSRAYCDSEVDFYDWIRHAANIKTVFSDFKQVQHSYFRSRVQQTQHVDGLLGTVVFQGDLGPFLPFLWLGERLHLGKGCVSGFGKYILQ